MKLSIKSIQENRDAWESLNYILPEYNIGEMIKTTKKNPKWIHFGYGNIFRAFPAVVCQKLLNSGGLDSGIIVAEGYDPDIIEKCMDDYDNLTISVTLNPDGTIKKEVVASVAESLVMDFDREYDTNRLMEIFAHDELIMASFTITEKGYNLKDANGNVYDIVEEDFKNPPTLAKTYMGKLTALLWHRFKTGARPLSLVSMDNCSENGDKLRDAILSFANRWTENHLIEEGFVGYIEKRISCPQTMIDKITPRPSADVLKILNMDNIDDLKIIETKKHTFVSPFVNAEAPQYLVIEDNFTNGTIQFIRSGIIYADKDIVDKAEKMKVSTCLNPLHTALAIFGCLLNFNKISDEMRDKDLEYLVRCLGYDEGMKVVVDPEVISPRDFIDEVINRRLPNPFMPDSPQRIACDTSQKMRVRFGETIKAYTESDTLNVEELEYIPFIIAGWLRYLMGVDDSGAVMKLSPDPMLDYLKEIMGEIKIGCTNESKIHNAARKIVSDEKIMGIDLYKIGLGKKVESYFKKLSGNTGAVRHTLHELNCGTNFTI